MQRALHARPVVGVELADASHHQIDIALHHFLIAEREFSIGIAGLRLAA